MRVYALFHARRESEAGSKGKVEEKVRMAFLFLSPSQTPSVSNMQCAEMPYVGVVCPELHQVHFLVKRIYVLIRDLGDRFGVNLNKEHQKEVSPPCADLVTASPESERDLPKKGRV